MSEQNIIPSAPPLYPSLGGDYRLKKISDCEKELENEISHYRKISKKYKRAKTIINAFAATTGSLAAVLSTASFTTFLTGIGAIIGAPIAGVATLMGIASTAAAISSERLNARVTNETRKKQVTHSNTNPAVCSTLRMRTAISPWQWQPWTAVSSLLGLISMA